MMNDENPPTLTGAILAGSVGQGAASRQSARGVLRDMAARKRREADQLEALANSTEALSEEAEEALWLLACGYLKR